MGLGSLDFEETANRSIVDISRFEQGLQVILLITGECLSFCWDNTPWWFPWWAPSASVHVCLMTSWTMLRYVLVRGWLVELCSSVWPLWAETRGMVSVSWPQGACHLSNSEVFQGFLPFRSGLGGVVCDAAGWQPISIHENQATRRYESETKQDNNSKEVNRARCYFW